jgi:hypothetical protein
VAGKDVTAADIARQVAAIAIRAAILDEHVRAVKDYLDTKSEADLSADPLNIPAPDATLYKTVVAELGTLMAVYRGEATQTPAHDFRVFLRRVAGLGVADQFRQQ